MALRNRYMNCFVASDCVERMSSAASSATWYPVRATGSSGRHARNYITAPSATHSYARHPPNAAPRYEPSGGAGIQIVQVPSSSLPSQSAPPFVSEWVKQVRETPLAAAAPSNGTRGRSVSLAISDTSHFTSVTNRVGVDETHRTYAEHSDVQHLLTESSLTKLSVETVRGSSTSTYKSNTQPPTPPPPQSHSARNDLQALQSSPSVAAHFDASHPHHPEYGRASRQPPHSASLLQGATMTQAFHPATGTMVTTVRELSWREQFEANWRATSEHYRRVAQRGLGAVHASPAATTARSFRDQGADVGVSTARYSPSPVPVSSGLQASPPRVLFDDRFRFLEGAERDPLTWAVETQSRSYGAAAVVSGASLRSAEFPSVSPMSAMCVEDAEVVRC